MKTRLIQLAAVISVLSGGIHWGHAQGFVNLNFESAVIVSDPSSGYYPYAVYASNALPGWTAYVRGTPQADVIYNTVPLADPWVTLQGPGGFGNPVQGNYFVMLWGQFDPTQSGNGTDTAAIGQTGLVPLSSMTVVFWGIMGGMYVTFGGQPLNFIQSGSTANFNIYEADISSFAGQTGQLLFVDPDYGNTFGGPSTIDNIQFSTNPIPEPGTLALGASGALLLGLFGWRKGLPGKEGR